MPKWEVKQLWQKERLGESSCDFPECIRGWEWRQYLYYISGFTLYFLPSKNISKNSSDVLKTDVIFPVVQIWLERYYGQVIILETFLTIFSFPVERYLIYLTAECWLDLFETCRWWCEGLVLLEAHYVPVLPSQQYRNGQTVSHYNLSSPITRSRDTIILNKS